MRSERHTNRAARAVPEIEMTTLEKEPEGCQTQARWRLSEDRQIGARIKSNESLNPQTDLTPVWLLLRFETSLFRLLGAAPGRPRWVRFTYKCSLETHWTSTLDDEEDEEVREAAKEALERIEGDGQKAR